MTKLKEKQNIPDGWKLTSVAELAEVQTGPFGSQLHESDYVKEGTPIITVENLKGGIVKETKTTPRVKDEDVKRLKKYTLKEGDVVFSRVGSVDRSAYVTADKEGWMFSGRLLRVRAKKGVRPKFLNYELSLESTKNKVRNLAVGGTMPSLNTAIFNFVPVHSLPEDEQDRIVKVLESWDEAIEKLSKIVALKREIKKGLMLKLLTGKLRLPDFKDEWISEKLATFVCVQSGDGFPIRLQGKSIGKYPFIKVSDMNLLQNQRKIVLANNYIDEKEVNEIRGKVFKKGSIVFPKIGAAIATNKKRILTQDTLVDNNVAVLVPNIENCNGSFLYHWLLQLNLMDWANSGGVPSIRKTAIESQPVIFPVLEEQQAIGNLLDTFDDEIDILQKKRTLYLSQKKYLLNNLVTGQIRTPENL